MMDHERTVVQKVILWVLLAMAVIFAAVNIALKFFPGVAFRGALLQVSHRGSTTQYDGKVEGRALQICSTPREESGGRREYRVELSVGEPAEQTCEYTVVLWDERIRTSYGDYIRTEICRDGELTFSGGYEMESGRFCDEEGQLLLIEVTGPVVTGDPGLSRSQVLRFALGQIGQTTRGSWLFYGVALFFSAICAVAAAFPRTLFELRYHWAVRDPEPTDFYLRMCELSCGLVAAVVLIIYLIGVTKIV